MSPGRSLVLVRPVRWLLAVGGVALLLSGWVQWPGASGAMLRAYLPGWLFWTGIPLGSLAWLMIHGLTGGAWGGFVRPALAAAAEVLPLNALLGLPLVFGLPELFAWAVPGGLPEGMDGGRAVYLRPGIFLAREAVLFGLWLGLVVWLGLWRRGLPMALPPGRCAAGLVLYGLGITVYAIDWTMSLEPGWASENVGFLAGAEALLAGLAFGTLAMCGLSMLGRWPRRAIAPRFHDLGGLLLAVLLVWSYLAFEQYLTLWSENLPDKNLWYLRRDAGVWRAWSWSMAGIYAAVPFFLLLSRRLKRDPGRLAWAAGLILAGNLMDQYWLVLPTFYTGPEALGWTGLLPWAGIGGLWLAAFLWRLPFYLSGAARVEGGIDG